MMYIKLRSNIANLMFLPKSLIHGDTWAPCVENAIGKLLNAFIVNDHKDSLLLRGCAKEANYNHLQIIIYDFSRPRYLGIEEKE